jgi:hypothetical protein
LAGITSINAEFPSNFKATGLTRIIIEDITEKTLTLQSVGKYGHTLPVFHFPVVRGISRNGRALPHLFYFQKKFKKIQKRNFFTWKNLKMSSVFLKKRKKCRKKPLEISFDY